MSNRLNSLLCKSKKSTIDLDLFSSHMKWHFFIRIISTLVNLSWKKDKNNSRTNRTEKCPYQKKLIIQNLFFLYISLKWFLSLLFFSSWTMSMEIKLFFSYKMNKTCHNNHHSPDRTNLKQGETLFSFIQESNYKNRYII